MDLATLGIRIDSSQAKAAFGDLENLAGAGANAEKAVTLLGTAGTRAAKGVSDTGKAAKDASKSIDDYVKKLQLTATTNGMGAREAKLYELALQGASKAQLQAADSAIRMNDGYERGVEIGNKLKTGFIAIAAAAVAAAGAIYAGTQKLIEQVANYKQLSEKIGDTAVSVASLKTASDVSGVSLDTIASASIRLTSALSKTDDESKLVGQAIKALGLNFDSFKKLSPVEQLDAVSKAMNGFADGSEKTAIALALFGKSGAELVPFLNDLADGSERNTKLTEEQIRAADEYSKAQARLKSEIESFLQVAAANAVPILVEIGDLFRSLAKSQTETAGTTDFVKVALNGAVAVFQTVAIIATDVVFTFKAVGREIGAIAAQLAALAHLDFSGFSAISDAVSDDAQRARKELDGVQAKIMAIGQSSAKFVDPRILGNPGTIAEQAAAMRPKLDISGLNRDKTPKGPKAVDTSRQDAKAQLQFDLEDIKKAQDAIVNAYSNTEKILEAQRSANLVNEQAYYGQKKKLLDLNSQAQEQSLQQQIARLQQETFAGKNATKDKLDNDRKILDLQAQLAKTRENAATSSIILGIQEAAAFKKIKDAIDEARISAQDYLDTQTRRNERELAGIGKGDQNRERDALSNTTDDKFLAQRQSLAGDLRRNQITKAQYDSELAIINDAHAKALKIDDDYFKAKLEKQKDFTLGAQEALQNYYDESQNVFKQTQEAVTNAFKGMEDALVEFATTGKLNFKSLIESILKDIARIAIKQQITGPLANALNGQLSGGGDSGSGGGMAGLFGSILGAFGGTGAMTTGANAMGGDSLDNLFKLAGNFSGRAIGGPVSAGGLYPVNERGPELLNVSGKQYLMMGSEGGSITPNDRISSGGGGGTTVHITQTFAEGTNRRTTDQAAQQAANAIRRAQRNS